MGNALHTDTKTSVKDVYPEIKKEAPKPAPTPVKEIYSGELPNLVVIQLGVELETRV